MKLKRLFIVTAFTALALVVVVFALFLVGLYLDQQRTEAAATRNYGPEAEAIAEAAVKIAAEAEATAKVARIVASKATADVVDHYKGEIRYGNAHGKGVGEIIIYDVLGSWEKRAVYEGEWSNGRPHGKGVIHWVDGNVYSGEWQNGELFGMGVIRFANGNTYEGEWKGYERDRWVYVDSRGRTGKGVYRWVNGDSWAGKFWNDKRYGKGIYRFTGGKAEIECFKGDSIVDC